MMNGHGTPSNANGEEGKDDMPPPPPPPYKLTHQSPIPERKHISREREEERRESSVRNYSPQVRYASSRTTETQMRIFQILFLFT